jgi:uncharacterized membrane protein
VITALVGGLLSSLWNGLLTVGYKSYALDLVRGLNPPTQKIFSGFPKVGPVLLTRLLYVVFTVLWTLLFAAGFAVVAVAGAFLMAYVGSALGIVILVAGYAAFLVGLCWISLRYAMVDFFLMDQGLTGLDAIRASKELMKGKKWTLFVLMLSFIGWYLLELAIFYAGFFIAMASLASAVVGFLVTGAAGALAGGIILLIVTIAITYVIDLWLRPYIFGSIARFYDWATGRQPELPAADPGPDQFDSYTYTGDQ